MLRLTDSLPVVPIWSTLEKSEVVLVQQWTNLFKYFVPSKPRGKVSNAKESEKKIFWATLHVSSSTYVRTWYIASPPPEIEVIRETSFIWRHKIAGSDGLSPFFSKGIGEIAIFTSVCNHSPFTVFWFQCPSSTTPQKRHEREITKDRRHDKT